MELVISLTLLLIGIAILSLLIILLTRLQKGLSINNLEPLFKKTEQTVQNEIIQNRKETQSNLLQYSDSLVKNSARLFESQQITLNNFSEKLEKLTSSNEQKLDTVRNTLELNLKISQDNNVKQLDSMRQTIDEKIEKLTSSNEQKLDAVRSTLEINLKTLQEDNGKQLDKMRQTVDEKLQSTLEKRISESFKTVNEQLQSVYKGLGEMQKLAQDVGNLQRVLTNVKERGTWGEYQLENILSELLTPEQFIKNMQITESRQMVEFAIKLPGKDEFGVPTYLPIDSKFPKEDYERLVDFSVQGDIEGVKSSVKSLLQAIEKSAKDIGNKYIVPPFTTDFAILFLPTEGLYAEALREPGFHDKIRSIYHVLIAGPTTLSAIINSLSVGFRTLAIEKRSHEVWNILGAVKKEFGTYNDVLKKLKTQLETASKTVDMTQKRTRIMEKKLTDVQIIDTAAILISDENLIDLDEA